MVSTPMAKVALVVGATAATSWASWRSRTRISSLRALARTATLRRAALVAWVGSWSWVASGRKRRQVSMTLLGRPASRAVEPAAAREQ